MSDNHQHRSDYPPEEYSEIPHAGIPGHYPLDITGSYHNGDNDWVGQNALGIHGTTHTYSTVPSYLVANNTNEYVTSTQDRQPFVDPSRSFDSPTLDSDAGSSVMVNQGSASNSPPGSFDDSRNPCDTLMSSENSGQVSSRQKYKKGSAEVGCGRGGHDKRSRKMRNNSEPLDKWINEPTAVHDGERPAVDLSMLAGVGLPVSHAPAPPFYSPQIDESYLQDDSMNTMSQGSAFFSSAQAASRMDAEEEYRQDDGRTVKSSKKLSSKSNKTKRSKK